MQLCRVICLHVGHFLLRGDVIITLQQRPQGVPVN